MAEEQPGRGLPQRVRGAARTAPSPPAPSSSPVLSEELRQRMRAAVIAERSGAAPKHDEAPGGETTSPAPVPEDEITEWLGTTAKPPSPVKPPTPSSPVKPPAGQSAAGSLRPAGRSRARWMTRFAAVVLTIGVLAVAAVMYFGRSPAGSPTSAAAAHQAAKARAAAASWAARHVSRDVKVSCDPAMCAALEARGFPAGELLALGSASAIPVSSAVVVETPAVLSLFGSSLATAWAPAVLASFGSRPFLVTVRVIDRNGSTAYQTKLRADLAERKTAGAALLHDSQISVPPLSSRQLTAGAVDSRLLEALVFVAGRQPISVVQFGNPGPGAGPGVPLRYVDLAELDPAHHVSSAAYVGSLRAHLSTADVRFRPAIVTTAVLADGQHVLRVEVTAPSPLGVFDPPAAP